MNNPVSESGSGLAKPPENRPKDHNPFDHGFGYGGDEKGNYQPTKDVDTTRPPAGDDE